MEKINQLLGELMVECEKQDVALLASAAKDETRELKAAMAGNARNLAVALINMENSLVKATGIDREKLDMLATIHVMEKTAKE